jgi:phosphoribosylanthranilate isomerase
MTRVRVKICGLTRLEDAELAVALGADAIGFILWPKSPRHVERAVAAAIARDLPPFVTRIGVFVNASPAEVETAVGVIGLDVAQLHGDEVAAEYDTTASRLMKVVTLESEPDVARALALPPAVTPLVDAADREKRGGTGTRANWELAARVARSRPVVLAGGLSPENIGDALRLVRPWGIDVSSGVEAAPGLKDAGKMRALFEAVRVAGKGEA